MAVSSFFKYPPQICITNATWNWECLCTRSSSLIHHSLSTLQVALIGLVIGGSSCAGFAILMDGFQWVNDLVYPFMVVIQTIPTIAFGPILVLWFGYGMLPKLVLIIITVVFPIVVSLLDGFRHLRSRYSEIVSDYESQSLSDFSPL